MFHLNQNLRLMKQREEISEGGKVLLNKTRRKANSLQTTSRKHQIFSGLIAKCYLLGVNREDMCVCLEGCSVLDNPYQQ